MASSNDREAKKERTCLRCGKLFQSQGAGNRVCKKCVPANDSERLPKQVPGWYTDGISWFDDEII